MRGRPIYEMAFTLPEVFPPQKGKFFALLAVDLAPLTKGIERRALRCMQETWFAKDANMGQRPVPSKILAGPISIPVRIPPGKLHLPVVIVR